MKELLKYLFLIAFIACLYSGEKTSAQDQQGETLRPLEHGHAPRSVDDLWKGFDPRFEPLETEVIREWEDNDVILRIVRFRIGIFKGKKAIMAAIYGFPKGARGMPGLVQIHGGGQYADYRAVLTNAKRGYATLSIAWAGRINAPGYYVDPAIVKLFWENKTNDPEYKITTDWGALDAYHAPCRNPDNDFSYISPAPWTLDSVESPRNNSWFLCALGARRALTFLEQQPEVDPGRLGVYGHSMGGKITVLTVAVDKRVKAAAPSCGGLSDRYSEYALYRSTLGDVQYLKRISCPILFLSPSNDFHGHINDLQTAIREIKSHDWRITCSAHHNHQDDPEFEAAGPLWFDQYLKGTFAFPQTPESTLELNTKNGVPLFTVEPDISKQILSVDIYYTQQGQNGDKEEERENIVNCFWHHASARQFQNRWIADLPLFSTEKPLWVYANVLYPLDEPVSGAGYYYADFTAKKVNLSSKMHIVTPSQLKAAGVTATLKPDLMIESFEGDWEKEWFTYNSASWARRTHKLHDDKWKAPSEDVKLAIEVYCPEKNFLQIELDGYVALVELSGKKEWQVVILKQSDFNLKYGNDLDNKAKVLKSWQNIKELVIAPGDIEDAEQKKSVWKGDRPEFRNLCWKFK